MNALKHIAKFGGLYLLVGAIYAVIFWVVPLTQGGSWLVVAGMHGAAGIIVWIDHGIASLSSPRQGRGPKPPTQMVTPLDWRER